METGDTELDTNLSVETHLEEQRDALRSVLELLEDDEHNEELLQMRKDLEETVTELEELLQSHPSAPGECIEQDGVVLGQSYRFRYMDGRWYHGVVESRKADSIEMRFSRPTKSFMLSTTVVPPELLRAAPLRKRESASKPQLGSRVLACEREGSLWVPAEISSISDSRAAVTFCDSGISRTLPLDVIALSAYATDTSDDSAGPKAGKIPIDRLEGSENESSQESDSDLEDQGHSATAAPGPSSSSQGGVQQETVTFADWEGHTRGMASKMMAAMGYVKGSALGARKQGMIDPLQVQIFRPQAGLGSEGSNLGFAEGSSNRKKKRGGQKARRRKKAEAAFRRREAKRDAEWQTEKETGSSGVFALLNKRLGDESEAAKIIKKADRRHAGQLSDGKRSKFGSQTMDKTPQAQNRKSLVAGQEEISAARARVAELQGMEGRNRKDAVLSKQIAAKLITAEAKLQSLEKKHQSSISALQSREKHKQWTKF